MVGFFFVDSIPMSLADLDVAARADLVQHTIAAAVQAPDPPREAVERLAPVVAGLYRSITDHIEDEWRRRVR
jgi:hypothetical protein